MISVILLIMTRQHAVRPSSLLLSLFFPSQAPFDADAQKGVCTWCKCGALPSSCWTVDNAKKLPPSVYICDSLNASIHNSNRLHLVDAINRANTSWKAGLNSRFIDKPVGVSKSLCGVKSQSREELLDLVERGIVKTEAHLPRQYLALEIPDSFDSAAAWPACAAVIDDIRDQSNCGEAPVCTPVSFLVHSTWCIRANACDKSERLKMRLVPLYAGCCWAFAAASAASDRMCIQTNGSIQVPLSAQATCFCAESNGCGGGTLYTPWAYIQSSGVVTGGQYNGTGPLGSNFCSDFSLPHWYARVLPRHCIASHSESPNQIPLASLHWPSARHPRPSWSC